jgi:hypothetical protein
VLLTAKLGNHSAGMSSELVKQRYRQQAATPFDDDQIHYKPTP